MTDLVRLYYSFWSCLGLPAYVEYSVPDAAELPYLTYTLGEGAFSVETRAQVRKFMRDSSFAEIAAYADSLENLVPEAGITLFLPDKGGAVYLYRGDPFIQHQPADETNLKILYCNIIIKNYIV
jgi:hypothetical protein